MTRLENMIEFLEDLNRDPKREPFATILWHLKEAERELAETQELLRQTSAEREHNGRMANEFRMQRDRLAEALREIKNELGVPQPEYPAPVANAVRIADDALAAVKGGEP
jgi:hypothetical protein